MSKDEEERKAREGRSRDWSREENRSHSWYDDFLELRAAVVRAVAISWATDKRQDFQDEFSNDPIAAMERWFHYYCPFNMGQNSNNNPYNQMGLQVYKAQAQASDPPPVDRFLPAHTGGWVGANNTIRLYLPTAPDNPDDHAEALAAFNQQHLFFLSYPQKKQDC